MSKNLTPINKLLIANRGEIAARVIRTCKKMGISTVAVFSEADKRLPFVDLADEAVCIGPAEASSSYLNIKAIIDAANGVGANAIHPGYGFLAENADFAAACQSAGILFVGPPPDVIRSMGSKMYAKDIASKHGVPIVPGYQGSKQDSAFLREQAMAVGFPLLLKASAGGGGKGMRRVDHESQLQDAIAGAKREAMRSFADDTLLIEKYIEAPRHVEVQILGDHHGNLIHLFERECSIQRRHQKIIEESPATSIHNETRSKLCEAALRLAKAIDYRNAGTVEFIMDADENFFFLEVNTRLQVEHAVTEAVTRHREAHIDLVEEQIRIAMGEPLRMQQNDLAQIGHSIEARIYAEDAANGFLPQSGTLTDWTWEESPHLRVDNGLLSGNEVGVHYDPMLAKFVTWGASRDDSIRTLARALTHFSAQGVTTNQRFLLNILQHPEYQEGNTTTHFVDVHADALQKTNPTIARRAACVATICDTHLRSLRREHLPHLPVGFRNNRFADQRADFWVSDEPIEVVYRSVRGNSAKFVTSTGESVELIDLSLEEDVLVAAVEIDSHRTSYRVSELADKIYVWSPEGSVELRRVERFPEKKIELPQGACIAPMPGKIVACPLKSGDTAEEGQVIVVMEAMKMEHSIRAPKAGIVSLHVSEGAQVEADTLLVSID